MNGESGAPEHPWERQPGETDSAWQAFVAYRDMGPDRRSLANVGRMLGKAKQGLERWSGRWRWVARSAAYDAWLDREAKLAEVEAVRDMRRRHVGLGRELQDTAREALARLSRAVRRSRGPALLRPREIVALCDLGTRLERLARGEVDEIETAPVEATPAHDYSRLTVEELRTLLALTRKAQAAEAPGELAG